MLVAEAVYQRLTSVLASQGLELKHPDDMSPNQAAFATTPAGRQFSESIFESPSLRNELAEAIRSASTEPFTAKALAGQLSNIKCLGMYVDLRNDGSVHCEPAHVTEELADQILDYAKSAVRLVDTYSSET